MPALCSAYGFPTNLAATADATIGIIELGGGFRAADISAALSGWSLPQPSITAVGVDGGANSPGDEADAEVVLDIQIAAAAYSYCTGRPAKVRVYFAPNTDAGFADAVARAASDGCATISISWGGPEASWGKQAVAAFDSVCASAVAGGATIFAASGDNLSGDGGRGNNVDFPASSTHVVGVGGTAKNSTSEVVWNEGGGGTGGGRSVMFAVPSWQVGIPAGSGRMVPDVAANADPATGYRIVLNGRTTVVGGTSCGAPLFAGLFAALATANGKSLGNVLPRLYQLPTCFGDITSGNNGAYQARPGPDECTGLGVPMGKALAAALLTPVVVPPPPPPPPSTKPTATIQYDPSTGAFALV